MLVVSALQSLLSRSTSTVPAFHVEEGIWEVSYSELQYNKAVSLFLYSTCNLQRVCFNKEQYAPLIKQALRVDFEPSWEI